MCLGCHVCGCQVDISLKKNIVIHVHVNDYLKSLRQKVRRAAPHNSVAERKLYPLS